MPIGVLSSYRFLPLYFSKCKYNSKGKSFKKRLIKNENSLRYVKLLPLLLYLLLEK